MINMNKSNILTLIFILTKSLEFINTKCVYIIKVESAYQIDTPVNRYAIVMIYTYAYAPIEIIKG